MRRARAVALPLLAAALFTAAPVPAAEVKNLSPGEARELLASDAEVFILDVRTPQEYFNARLEGARLIPIDQFGRRAAEVPGDRPVLVYCAVGSRSSQVAHYLVRQGHAPVYNLFGGIWGWQLKGYPVLKGPP